MPRKSPANPQYSGVPESGAEGARKDKLVIVILTGATVQYYTNRTYVQHKSFTYFSAVSGRSLKEARRHKVKFGFIAPPMFVTPVGSSS